MKLTLPNLTAEQRTRDLAALDASTAYEEPAPDAWLPPTGVLADMALRPSQWTDTECVACGFGIGDSASFFVSIIEAGAAADGRVHADRNCLVRNAEFSSRWTSADSARLVVMGG